jgi:hypothetical protein
MAKLKCLTAQQIFYNFLRNIKAKPGKGTGSEYFLLPELKF